MTFSPILGGKTLRRGPAGDCNLQRDELQSAAPLARLVLLNASSCTPLPPDYFLAKGAGGGLGTAGQLTEAPPPRPEVSGAEIALGRRGWAKIAEMIGGFTKECAQFSPSGLTKAGLNVRHFVLVYVF